MIMRWQANSERGGSKLKKIEAKKMARISKPYYTWQDSRKNIRNYDNYESIIIVVKTCK